MENLRARRCRGGRRFARRLSFTSASPSDGGSSRTCVRSPVAAACPFRCSLPPTHVGAAWSRRADNLLVHAHWIPSGIAALATRKPFVLQVWAQTSSWRGALRWLIPGRLVVRRARLVISRIRVPRRASGSPARGSWRCARASRTASRIPRAEVGEPADPPHVLFVGRLSEEKGILGFLEATDGLAARDRRRRPAPRPRPGVRTASSRTTCWAPTTSEPQSSAFPSRREGYGVVAREAMAYGRPVVATAVGGLRDAVEDGVTGLLVAPAGPRRPASGDRASARRPRIEARARDGRTRPGSSGAFLGRRDRRDPCCLSGGTRLVAAVRPSTILPCPS